MSGMTKQAEVMGTLEDLLSSLEKSAEATNETGGYDGPTEHPVKNKEDNTDEGSTGSRASEHESDIQDEYGAAGVDGDPVNKAASMEDDGTGKAPSQDKVQFNIGVTQAATGEQPEAETNRAGAGKDDDGGPRGAGQSSHPARTNNDQIDGKKWASAEGLAQAELLLKQAEEHGRAMIADLAVDTPLAKEANELYKESMCGKCGKADCSGCGKHASDDSNAQAAADLAKAAAEEGATPDDPVAKQAAVQQAYFETLMGTYERGLKVAQLAQGFLEGQKQAAAQQQEQASKKANAGNQSPAGKKTAEEGSDSPVTDDTKSDSPPEDSEKSESSESEDSDAPPSDGGGEGGEGGIADALAGEGGGEGAAEAPPEDPAAMGDPAAGGGGGLADALGGGEMAGAPMPGAGAEPPVDGGGLPPAGGADPLAGAMGGAEPPPMGAEPPPMGAEPPPMGADPAAGGMPPEAGGMPPEGGAMGGAPSPEDIQMLNMIMQQLGITPEDLMAGATAKAAQAIQNVKKAGATLPDWKPKTAEDEKKAEYLRNYISEMLRL